MTTSKLKPLLALALCLAWAPSAAWAQIRMYASRNDGIYEVNTTTGALVTPALYTLTGSQLRAALAQRNSDGMLFFISGSNGNDTTYRYNPSTPAVAPVRLGTTGSSIPYLPRLAFSTGGTLYAVDVTTSRLYTINTSTGAATATGATLTGGPSGSVGGDLAFAPNGVLYSVLNANVYVIPITGGALTNRGAISGMTSPATGMAFDARGRLLVSADNGTTMYDVANYASGTPTATAIGNVALQIQDLASVIAPDLRVTKSHSGNFNQGQTGATYTITVRDSGNVATSATVTVSDTLPAGLTPVSAAGTGWTCAAPSGQVLSCSRSDALASGAAYPVITVTVNVATNAAASLTNTARASGGGEDAGNPFLTGNNAAADATTVIVMAVIVTPDGIDTLRLLPSNATVYRKRLAVRNGGASTANHDLFAFTGGGVFVTVDSITGTAVTHAARPDSARMTGPAAGVTDSADVWFRVGGVAAGSVSKLYLAARVVGSPTVRDSGWTSVQVVRPSLTTTKSVTPNGVLSPGTNLVYTITVVNGGTSPAVNAVTIDSLAAQTRFAVGSVSSTLPSGMTVVVAYSNNGGSAWTYTPLSAGCGAPAGFDDCVTHVRWTLQNPLSQVAPNNTAVFSLGARIR